MTAIDSVYSDPLRANPPGRSTGCESERCDSCSAHAASSASRSASPARSSGSTPRRSSDGRLLGGAGQLERGSGQQAPERLRLVELAARTGLELELGEDRASVARPVGPLAC